MITLTTGVPGSGKSLYSISYIKLKAEKENRDVFYHGIKDLALPWVQMDDPTKWDDLPAGSIIVIDECQTIFRPRGAGSQVPPYIAAMETHRHKGYDIFLITQHPMLVDQNIRRLVGQHFHVVRKFGMERATVHEFGSCHEITQRNLGQAVRHDFKYTQEAYSYYKSAELHTHKRRIPARVWFMLAAPLLIIGLGYLGYQKIVSSGDVKGRVQQVASKPATLQPTTALSPASGAPPVTKTTAQYLVEQQPRVAGLAWTAPVYDEVTKPIDAPRPMSCLVSHSKNTCRCIDQQGNDLLTTESFCRQFVEHGMFIAWKQPEPAEPAGRRQAKRDDPPELPASRIFDDTPPT